MIAATLATGAEFRVQSRRALFSAKSYRSDSRNRAYTISPDDSWFLFAEQTASQVNELVVVQNWFEELKAKVR